MRQITEHRNIFLRMHPIHRILISLGLSAIAFLLFQKRFDTALIPWVIAWDVFGFFYCFTCWIVFFTRSTGQIKQQATKEDGSRAFVIGVVLLASFASMIMVLMLMLSDDASQESKLLTTLLAITGMMLSWAIVHTTFGFHYAHIYYNNDESGKRKTVCSLSSRRSCTRPPSVAPSTT